MDRTSRSLKIIAFRVAVLFGVALTVPLSSSAQTKDPYSPAYRPVNTKSRAELDAEQRVALSADKLIDLLRQEPGLLLEAKRVLVRKAYEQGRILDPDDLTDEALFQLLREDQNVRVLVTREIEDRAYIRAKPTREQVERERELNVGNSVPASASQAQNPADLSSKPANKEEAYWQKHDDSAPRYQQSQPESQPSQTGPAMPTVPRNTAPVENPARQVEMTALPQNQDLYDGMGPDTGIGQDASRMTRIAPEQLPGLLSTSASAGTNFAAVDGAAPRRDRSGSRVAPSYPSPYTSGLDIASSGRLGAQYTSGNSGGFDQQASLEMPQQQRPSAADLNLDRPQIRRRVNPYANVPSLYDLYSQVSPRSPMLERFGASIFRNGTGNIDKLPMDLPAGPDYVLGPGDGVSIDIWGGVAQRLQRVVDPSGRLSLPEAGTVPVVGKTLGDVQRLVQAALRTQFHEVEADVSLSRIRSIRVYVVGEVENPGPYDISSLSTPLNALYAAGGPTSRGSLRHLRLFRGKDMVQEVDAYDLLLHGVHGDLARIQSGDTIQVPPMGAEVTVAGMVMHPGIYELRNENNLAETLELAGGVLRSGTFRHIEVERVIAHQSHTMMQLEMPETDDAQAVNKALNDFKVQDGDRIRISPILPYSDKTVYLDGHVFHPGKYAYRDGMKLTDLIHSYNDLLPEPYRNHAEVIRLKAPDFTPEVLAFNLEDALEGKDQDLVLKPFDTVRIFGRYDFEDPPAITVSGEVRDPGDHVTNGATYLRDAIFLAGNATADAKLDDVQVFRKSDDGKLKVLSVNLGKALQGDQSANIMLLPKDRVFVHKSVGRSDPPAVSIEGDVERPGKYPLGENMSAADLVRLAGGLKRSAYTEQADLTRYMVEHGEKVIGDHQTVQIAAALAGEPDTDVRLHDGDVLTIRQLAGWTDMGATITVKGEVLHPGTFGITEGERLSSILERAGGLRSDAYPYGAIFERTQVRDLEEKNKSQLIRQVQDEGAGLKAVDDPLSRESAALQWKNTLEKLQNTPPTGRMVIHISSDMKRWANTPADIQVRAGDVIYIPKKPNFVTVDGAVYNPTAVTFKPGKSAGWYLNQAGGPTTMANKKAIFVVRADGSVVGGKGGMFSGGAVDAALQPGDMVVVPDKAFGGGLTWKNTLQVAQLVSAIGIAVQVAKGF